MSDQWIEQSLKQCLRPFIFCHAVLCLVVMIGAGLLPAIVHAEQRSAANGRSLPMLVRAGKGDTSVSLASRYLNDPSKAWMIAEYNGMVSFSDGQAVLIPTAPFRLGGLAPDGYQSVPVIAYEAIGPTPGKSAAVSRAVLEEQMSWLKNSGFTTIRPQQLIEFMAFSGQLPPRAVLITADTDSASFFEQAFPVLESFGLTATVCVAPARIGKPGNMTWSQLQQLNDAGFSVGCRVRFDRPSTRRQTAQSFKSDFTVIEDELRQAKRTVEHHLGLACTVLAGPCGQSDDLIAAMVAKIGFSAVFVHKRGENSFFGNRYGIHRVVIDRRLSPEEFTQMLTTSVTVDLR